MILLDTNVVSELMRPTPEPRVLQWLDAQPAADVWISAVTVSEIRLGIALLPDGQRKKRLTGLAEAMFQEDFSGSCLSYDVLSAAEYEGLFGYRGIAASESVDVKAYFIRLDRTPSPGLADARAPGLADPRQRHAQRDRARNGSCAWVPQLSIREGIIRILDYLTANSWLLEECS